MWIIPVAQVILESLRGGDMGGGNPSKMTQ